MTDFDNLIQNVTPVIYSIKVPLFCDINVELQQLVRKQYLVILEANTGVWLIVNPLFK